jgi:hypothetical protein
MSQVQIFAWGLTKLTVSEVSCYFQANSGNLITYVTTLYTTNNVGISSIETIDVGVLYTEINK